MGETVARSIVGRLSPKPQALSNPGVARLCPRGMLLGGNGLHKQTWELGLKENECVSSRQGSRASCTTAVSDGYSRGCVVEVALA